MMLIGEGKPYLAALVVVGAFVRLTNAGLGCPDWPGCYGQLTPAHAALDIAKAVAEQGGTHGPVSIQKAWHEMFHRYLAGTLGLLVLGIAAMAWMQGARQDLNGRSPWLATLSELHRIRKIFMCWARLLHALVRRKKLKPCFPILNTSAKSPTKPDWDRTKPLSMFKFPAN